MNARDVVQDLLDFIDASPSPWHAVETIENIVRGLHFQPLTEGEKWHLHPNGRYYVVRDDSSIVLFVIGNKPLTENGFRIVGAHTDSPGLRLKPNGPHINNGWLRLGVEIYGSPILATFTDRDLSLAGRISVRGDDGQIHRRLVRFKQPLLRLPNLPIHVNRAVNDEGLKLHKQNELPLLLGWLTEQMPPRDYFQHLLETAAKSEFDEILGWEFQVYDTQPGSFWGAEQEFYANGQIDNLASCHAAFLAMTERSSLESGNTLVCALFDHEEIGSETHKGAQGNFLPQVLQRIAHALELNEEDYARALHHSFLISADMAHALQPNFPNAYEPEHGAIVNRGPVIKINHNQRYATDIWSEAQFANWCDEAGVPYQKYVHRSDLACGSTIGPIVASKLGLRTVDVGNAMWAMHSARESAGVLDHHYMIRVLRRFFEH